MVLSKKDQIRIAAENDLEVDGKHCTKCKQLKPFSGFGKRSTKLLHSWCKSCQNVYAREEYKKDPLKQKDSSYRRQYNITLNDYDEMRKAQNYCCAICGIHEDLATRSALHVDHDHKTGKVRGLLCLFCNTVLGKVHDSAETLQKMIEYLDEHK